MYTWAVRLFRGWIVGGENTCKSGRSLFMHIQLPVGFAFTFIEKWGNYNKQAKLYILITHSISLDLKSVFCILWTNNHYPKITVFSLLKA